jgi:hypothetical protein
VGATELRYREDYYVFVNSPSGTIRAPLVYVNAALVVPPFDPAEYPDCTVDPGGYDDYAGIDSAGAIILRVWPGAVPDDNAWVDCPAEPVFTTGVARGALGWISAVPDSIFVMGYGLAEGDVSPGHPMLRMRRAVADTVVPDLAAWESEITATGTPRPRATGLEAAIEVDATVTPMTIDNVVGALPGSAPAHESEVVLVGAHMDAWGTYEFDGTMYPGANDHASGTTTMMELARGVVEGIGAPARTVVFAAWNAEEWGLLGSCAYVDRPSYPLSSMTALISMEQLGLESAVLDVIGGAAPENRWLFELMRTRQREERLPGALQAIDMSQDTDHWCFWNAGVPVLSVAGLGEDWGYHSPEDDIDGVSRENLGGNAHLVWLALEPLARATEGANAE